MARLAIISSSGACLPCSVCLLWAELSLVGSVCVSAELGCHGGVQLPALLCGLWDPQQLFIVHVLSWQCSPWAPAHPSLSRSSSRPLVVYEWTNPRCINPPVNLKLARSKALSNLLGKKPKQRQNPNEQKSGGNIFASFFVLRSMLLLLRPTVFLYPVEGFSVHEIWLYPCRILALMTDSGSIPLQNSLSPVSHVEPQKFTDPYQVQLTKPLGTYPPQN